MPRKGLEVKINPAILKWARESAGLGVREVARRFGRNVETVKEWEAGTKNPTLRILEELAMYYKRPLAAFFLPKPPPKLPMPTDFRVLPGRERPPLSKETRLAIRGARRLQSIAKELMKDIGFDTTLKIGRIDLNDHPEKVAAEERERLGIGIGEQFSWKDSYMAFRRWRRAIENLNILVFQMRMPMKDTRGFSLWGEELPAIVVNASDSINGRIFTLFHEYTHLLLGTTGICIPNEVSHFDAVMGREEEFCNYSAGAFLVPRNALHENIRSTTHLAVHDYLLSQIAMHFKVSREVILRRMEVTGLISRELYRNKLREWESQREAIGRKGGFFGITRARRCVQEKGPLFISLVLEARERDLITYSDVADYLSIRMKHLDKVQSFLGEQKLSGRH